jgi:LPXTG-motif cell wall-anchored protein
VWAALGGYARRGFPPLTAASGHLFVSHDAGEHFSDASGTLPDAVANSVTLRADKVIVGTDVGTFVAAQSGASFTRLGTGFPNAPVWRTNLNPDGSVLVVATHGRGIWSYDFGAPAVSPSTTGTGRGTLPATGADRETATLLAAALLLLAAATRHLVIRSR